MVELDETIIRDLYFESKLSMREIASQLGTSLSSLTRFMQKHGIPFRTKGEAQANYLAEHEHQSLNKRHSEATKDAISKASMRYWDNISPKELKRRRDKYKQYWKSLTQEQRDHHIKRFTENRVQPKSGQRSKLEQFLSDELKNAGFFVEDRTSNYGSAKAVDIVLPSLNIAIEVDGPTHFLPIYGEDALAAQHDRDERKNEELCNNNMHVIRIKNRGQSMRRTMNKLLALIKEIEQHDQPSVWHIN